VGLFFCFFLSKKIACQLFFLSFPFFFFLSRRKKKRKRWKKAQPKKKKKKKEEKKGHTRGSQASFPFLRRKRPKKKRERKNSNPQDSSFRILGRTFSQTNQAESRKTSFLFSLASPGLAWPPSLPLFWLFSFFLENKKKKGKGEHP